MDVAAKLLAAYARACGALAPVPAPVHAPAAAADGGGGARVTAGEQEDLARLAAPSAAAAPSTALDKDELIDVARLARWWKRHMECALPSVVHRVLLYRLVQQYDVMMSAERETSSSPSSFAMLDEIDVLDLLQLQPSRKAPLDATTRRQLLLEHAQHLIEPYYNELVSACTCDDAHQMATAEARAMGREHQLSLVYGEVEFSTLVHVLGRWIRPKRGGVFVDVGSGSGRPIFAALMLHQFDEYRGIEILSSLHDAATTVRQRFVDIYDTAFPFAHRRLPSLLERVLSASAPADTRPSSLVRLLHADFRHVDWSDADVVYVNSTCFERSLMADLTACCRRLKLGAYVATMTYTLHCAFDAPDADFRLLARDEVMMSWGGASVCIHVKVTPAASEAASEAASAAHTSG